MMVRAHHLAKPWAATLFGGRMRRAAILILLMAATTGVLAQGFESAPVFRAQLLADREPAVAGDELRLAVVLRIDPGWHVNTDQPGDEFSMPTTLVWELPEEWPEPLASFPDGESLRFEFSETPVEVWEGKVTVVAVTRVPTDATPGKVPFKVRVTAQACNSTQCLPPTEVVARVEIDVAASGSGHQQVNTEVFQAAVGTSSQATTAGGDGDTVGLADKSLPLLLILVFFGGLALNLTPCVFPLIPITVGFFAQQTKGRSGSSFGLALAYVMGIAVTYSVLGVLAALGGALFGGALQSPWLIGVIVFVLLALSTSMFGLWELRVPGWAQSASGGRSGLVGALIMGLVMGFVAAPCIGPFVIGLLTLVGQRGDPFYGFLLFFTLALGLGLPYLLLGTFTGLVNRLPVSGMWMIGVRRVFGVVLIAMAAYFAAPLLPGDIGGWLMSAVLVAGALYLLVVDRTGHEQPTIDRVMRISCVAMLAVGLLLAPVVHLGSSDGVGQDHLEWQPFSENAARLAIDGGGPVIVDFYADWCAPCKELDAITFADAEVHNKLADFARFKVDLTRSSAENTALQKTYEVRGVPTVIVYDGGSEVFRITGFEAPAKFLERLP